MVQPPVGTVTFLFTDIEGSTKLWQKHPDTMHTALDRHHALLHESIAAHGGYVFQIIGDAFCAAFSTANDGLDAAVKAQRALSAEPWGDTGAIRVRMALHTGIANIQVGEYTSGEYVSGLTLSRAARLLSAGHGGQILLSLPTTELVRDHLPQDIALRDLGARRLKDLIRPEHIFQAVIPNLQADFAPLKTLDVHPHNLPVQLTSFIGREREMGEVKKLLAGTHLLTLTGIGGTGKTRLALQAAADLIDEFAGGVWLVELAPLSDPLLVAQTIASVLDVTEQFDRPLSDILTDYVREKQLLIVLDNCEHVLEACAQIVDALQRGAPGLRILATSRVPLNVTGETTYPVPPLFTPDPKRLPLPSALVQYEAVRLFIERALSVQPAFQVTNANAPAVAQICTHLDGIPLAIELAAARVRLLSPEQISARLGDRFNLLTGGSRSVLPRQQTLLATMDWSYDLLSEPERILFNRLAVFPGSFSLEAVEKVCSDGPGDKPSERMIRPSQVLDLLSALVDHSLVSVQERNSEARYIMLETVHQYTWKNLQANNELPVLKNKHFSYFFDLVIQGKSPTYAGDPAWTARYEIEFDNIRSAMEYAIATDRESAILLEDSLSMFIDLTSRQREASGWARRILALTEDWQPGKLRATALRIGGWLIGITDDNQQGQNLMEASLEMAEQIGDKNQIKVSLQALTAWSYNQNQWEQMRNFALRHLEISQEAGDKVHISDGFWQLGEAISNLGEIEEGRIYLERSLDMARQENIPNQIAFALKSLARLARLEGDHAKAIELYLECVEIRKGFNFTLGVASTLIDLAQVYLIEGDTIRARACSEESLEIYTEYNHFNGRINCLVNFASIAGIHGQDERAVRLFGASEALSEKHTLIMEDDDRMVYDPIKDAVRKRLGESAFDAALAEGRQLTLEQALELVQE